MSPQLSNWIYGFFPHSFIQHIRGDGFRPVVFLEHGLWLGIFLCMAVLGACALWRQALRDRVQAAPWLAATLWLALTLVLSRNLGATALMLLFAPVILFAPTRMQVLVAAVFAGTVLTYPMLRGAGLVPTDAIHALAQSVSEERASRSSSGSTTRIRCSPAPTRNRWPAGEAGAATASTIPKRAAI